MTTTAVVISILASLFSGVVGALISTVIYIRRDNRKTKVDTLKRFAANRYDLRGDEFSRAINEIFVVFNDVPAVMQALSEFHTAITSKQANGVAENALMKLYKAMCKDTRIDFSQFNDSFFLIPFNTRAASALQIQSVPAPKK